MSPPARFVAKDLLTDSRFVSPQCLSEPTSSEHFRDAQEEKPNGAVIQLVHLPRWAGVRSGCDVLPRAEDCRLHHHLVRHRFRGFELKAFGTCGARWAAW